ncbi:MAG: GIY-YIG nuclease family protein [bacterium]
MSDVKIRYFLDKFIFAETINKIKGVYLLLLSLPENTNSITRQKKRFISKGCYMYIGSAMGGLSARVSRYFKRKLNQHWHIDFLLSKATIEMIVAIPSDEDIECKIARFISSILGWSSSITGFGSSDCSCPSHLFLLPDNNFIHNLLKEGLWKGIGYFPEEIYCLSSLE